MTVAYVFQLLAFSGNRTVAEQLHGGLLGSIDVTPPEGCVMIDWKLDCRGDVIIRWRKTPGPGNVTPLQFEHFEESPR